jgi:hypothetical protein
MRCYRYHLSRTSKALETIQITYHRYIDTLRVHIECPLPDGRLWLSAR